MAIFQYLKDGVIDQSIPVNKKLLTEYSGLYKIIDLSTPVNNSLLTGTGNFFFFSFLNFLKVFKFFFRKRLSMDVSMSRCGLPTGLVWL